MLHIRLLPLLSTPSGLPLLLLALREDLCPDAVPHLGAHSFDEDDLDDIVE